ncbi:WbqC family protein [Desertivirga xinjiangensis]|uniref:WbqC family protein n=1 Tax=Desertivirga xinjiangensis TaxID=539206 RepID=UPI00210AB374|nr:WbqC family protein [Pedobacter xinjiangensis]
MNKGAIFPLFYLPPVSFFPELLQYKDHIVIERFEHFPKQTYRNRASIHSPQGKLDLIIPVVKGSKVHTKVKDVRISYDFQWQRLHWLSLQSSYRSSAYFEFYEDEFAPFFEKKWDFLFDFNSDLLQVLLKLLKININLSYSEEYEKEYADLADFRHEMNPKAGITYSNKTYYQVFDDRNGFLPNLSIVDLLFNQGPQSIQFI